MLLFSVGEQVYGCDIGAVREIIPQRAATRLPGAPPFVTGLINLRGTIVTVLDLGRRLERGDAARGEGSVILCEVGTKLVGLAHDLEAGLAEDVADHRPHEDGVVADQYRMTHWYPSG